MHKSCVLSSGQAQNESRSTRSLVYIGDGLELERIVCKR
jgi:hypothetical protein